MSLGRAKYELSGAAVVTGGGRGIGRCFADGLAEAGMHVIAVDSDEVALDEAFSDSPNVTSVVADVTVDGALDEVAAASAQPGRPLKVWVNGAGVFEVTPSEELTAEKWDRTMAINTRGVLLGCKAAAAHMSRDGGSIVNMSSAGATVAVPGLADYCASKAAVQHLTRVLAIEWGPRRIRVNAIAPGFIDTRMLAWMRDDPEERERQLARVPLGRIGTPQDVLGALLYLASDESSYVSGTTLYVDGGLACS